MNKGKLTDRQKYFTKAKGLPLFKQFDRIKYVAWIDGHEKDFLKSIGKSELKGIEDYKNFNDYLRTVADRECSKL